MAPSSSPTPDPDSSTFKLENSPDLLADDNSPAESVCFSGVSICTLFVAIQDLITSLLKVIRLDVFKSNIGPTELKKEVEKLRFWGEKLLAHRGSDALDRNLSLATRKDLAEHLFDFGGDVDHAAGPWNRRRDLSYQEREFAIYTVSEQRERLHGLLKEFAYQTSSVEHFEKSLEGTKADARTIWGTIAAFLGMMEDMEKESKEFRALLSVKSEQSE